MMTMMMMMMEKYLEFKKHSNFQSGKNVKKRACLKFEYVT